MSVYSVINMDMVNSRQIKDRVNIQYELKIYFEKLYLKYNHILVAPITFTLGDEWQIVLRDIRESYNIFNEIKVFLLSKDIRCYGGIGIGNISTAESKDTREMDGESFIYAREAINAAKTNSKFYKKVIHTKDCRVNLLGKPINFFELNNNHNYVEDEIIPEVAITSNNEFSVLDIINIIMQNNEMIESKFTDKQREIIELYEMLGSYNEVEKKYPQYSKSSISHKLTSSNYFLTIYNKKNIYSLLGVYSRILRERYNGV